MGKYANIVLKWVPLFLTFLSLLLLMSIYMKLSCPSLCDYSIYKDMYILHVNFLQLIMVIATAILAVLSIAFPFVAYNWNKDRQRDFMELKKEMKDDYRQMKIDMLKDRDDVKEDIKEAKQTISNDINNFSYQFLIERFANNSSLKNEIQNYDYSTLRDITKDDLKKEFKDGFFTELCINHLISLVKTSGESKKTQIINNLRKIREQEHCES